MKSLVLAVGTGYDACCFKVVPIAVNTLDWNILPFLAPGTKSQWIPWKVSVERAMKRL